MPIQVRILFLSAIAALALGWVGLRRGNEALAARAAAAKVVP